jgi:hypothetical protein
MYVRDPAEAVEVLNLLLKFFGDGEREATRCHSAVQRPDHA